uniref:Predicted protein n=1 Tax=Physcomitrium patens TaxID=3218 RepID=A9U5V6_PHYPA
MEEKRRGNFDDTREGNSSKRQTRGDKAREGASQELPVKDTSVSLEEKTRETKNKGKSIAYNLLSHIEAATNLKGVLEERILNAKVEFTLKEVLEIAKKEFHDVIIDSIKRKRQLMGETGMSHAIDARIYKDEEEVDIGYKQPTNEKNGYNQREQHFFVQDTTSYPLILKQPYIMATRMETKVLDNGSAYARVRSKDGRKVVQSLTVPPNHEWNQDRLKEKPLPKIVEGFKDFGEVEKLTLEPNKVDLFLQAADGELQGKLELLLEDKEEDEGLTTKWKNVEDAVGLLTKREKRKDRSNIPKTVQAPKAPIRTTPPTMLTVQPSTSLSKKADMGMKEFIRGIRDLQIKLARLEENTSINNSKNVSKQGYVQRCIWCDDASHTRKDCNEFNNMIRQGIICCKDGKIVLKNREDLLQTNFGKGGMRALVEDYLKEHETVARESASYGARVDDEIGGSTETKKRRGNFDDTREGNSSKRQTRGDKAREGASQELPVKDTSVSLEEKTRETKNKDKSIAYNLLSHIEAATNLKGVLEERILNAKVEFTLKEVLGITKKEFHDVIIDNIKQKRQLMGETGMSHAIDAKIYKDEEEIDMGYKQPTNEKNGYNQRVHFEDYSDKKMETLSHYTRKHWVRATIEVLVKVGDIEEPIIALVDYSS